MDVTHKSGLVAFVSVLGTSIVWMAKFLTGLITEVCASTVLLKRRKKSMMESVLVSLHRVPSPRMTKIRKLSRKQ